MRFFLRTGFGESKTMYGGFHEERLAGFGQGNAAAGPGFTAMSSLIVNAYLCNEFGAQIYSSYYKQLLLLAAVMYVDDTDLIHWARCPSCSPDQLIATAQTATYAWGGLAITTGAAMKPDKCYVYFLSYWYDLGRAKLRTINALPGSIASITLPNGVIAPSHLRVPLPDGTAAPIPTLRNEDASLMLGVWAGPASGGSKHIREMARKGYTWADRMKSRPLPTNLAWKSFNHQLQLGMMWGITTVVMSPLKLLEQFQRVYFQCLPLLNVNCHIDLPWRLIPERYQGLGMANYALVSLASKFAFLQCNWRFDFVHSKSTMMAYESLMIEVGLYGNTMSYDYKKHSMLVTNNTWFKNVWELTLYFKVRLNFDNEFHLKAVRQGDKSLMAEFMHVGKFTQSYLVSLNIMRMHKKVVHTSDIVLCDGKTIKSEMLTNSPGHSETHKFPTQRPFPADLILWKIALRMISSAFLVLTVPLQEYVCYLHNLPQWMINNDGLILHNIISMGNREYHKVYIPTSKLLACKT